MSSGNVLVRVQSLHKSYLLGRYPLHVLRGCSITLADGEFVAIMGASGSGKSTLLHIMGALDTPDKGKVLFDDRDLFAERAGERDRLRNQAFGFVFQFYHLLPELNVLENVLLPAMVGSSVGGWLSVRHDARAYAEQVIDEVGLTERIRHRPNELSGGERQRVATARALVNRPRVLLADEPTGNLDTATGREVLSLLSRLNQQGQTIVMVTHDAAVAAAAHRVVTLVDGQVKGKAATERRSDVLTE
jgi:lipoprotein-releasing system ATP-binding protein